MGEEEEEEGFSASFLSKGLTDRTGSFARFPCYISFLFFFVLRSESRRWMRRSLICHVGFESYQCCSVMELVLSSFL